MKIAYSTLFLKKFKKIIKNDRKLSDEIKKTVVQFQNNPRHPSLRLHKLSGDKKEYWSISVNKSIRIVFSNLEEVILFHNVGTHDEVY
jgi:addiction module RelE/StbE family toxin